MLAMPDLWRRRASGLAPPLHRYDRSRHALHCAPGPSADARGANVGATMPATVISLAVSFPCLSSLQDLSWLRLP